MNNWKKELDRIALLFEEAKKEEEAKKSQNPKKMVAGKREEDSAPHPLPLCKDYLDHVL